MVVGYVRVSTDGQAEEGVSLDAQRSAIESYCSLRGLSLVDVVTDPGVSAGKPLASRVGGRQVLQMLRDRAVGGVVAMKLDRLFRSAVDCLSTVAQWDSCGFALHLLDLGGSTIDTSTAVGKMFLTMVSGFAELERNLACERTTAALQRKISRGERAGRVPYGYAIAADDIHLVPDPDEQDVLCRLRTLRSHGKKLQEIVDAFNQEAVPVPQARRGGQQGTRWHLATVHRLLHRAERNLA
jgi:DNA invertase Pin-like site-specific DNA recombinase